MTRQRDSIKTDDGYVVFVNFSVNRYSKKVRNEQMYVVDPDGEIIGDICGGVMGYYNRLSLHLVKEFAKAFAESQLCDAADLQLNIPLRNIILKDYDEIDKILDRATSKIYDHLKELR